MTEPSTPDASQPSGVSHSGMAPRWSGFVGRPWFWILLIGLAWFLPLIKSLDADFPDPPEGFAREPEAFVLIDLEGREVSAQDLGGFLLVLQPLRLGSVEQAQDDFLAFRLLKQHLRSMGTIMVHVLLCDGAEPPQLKEFLDERTARKPSNLFLLDRGGAVFEQLRESAGVLDAVTLVLDRHGRLRGAFRDQPQDAARLSRVMTLLGNWEGCDPPLGEPVTH